MSEVPAVTLERRFRRRGAALGEAVGCTICGVGVISLSVSSSMSLSGKGYEGVGGVV